MTLLMVALVLAQLADSSGFVTLTSPDGQPVFISPKAIAGLRETGPQHGAHHEAKCAILVNAGTVYVSETCDEVRRAITEQTGSPSP